ncbi:MAG TPA: hypothetical protein VEI98_13655 [Xanthobacteraceae bacterium]|nr:hypothetical protein [Xanthobacteraceae bacterium]
MDYSLPAWLGALVGTIVAVAIYAPGIRIIERGLRARSGPLTLERRRAFEERLSVIRRMILGADIAILAIGGYWIGKVLGGMRG